MSKINEQANKKNVEEIKFSKEQIVKSQRYTDIEKDTLNSLLEARLYTIEEVNKTLEEFNDKEAK
jgi:hypothetical protein